MVLLPASAVVVAAAPRTHTVVIDKMKFGAMPRAIRVGDSIRWINRDIVKHTATANDRSFNLDLAPGKSGTTVMRHAGRIPVLCIYHPGMKASLNVAK